MIMALACLWSRTKYSVFYGNDNAKSRKCYLQLWYYAISIGIYNHKYVPRISDNKWQVVDTYRAFNYLEHQSLCVLLKFYCDPNPWSCSHVISPSTSLFNRPIILQRDSFLTSFLRFDDLFDQSNLFNTSIRLHVFTPLSY
jgi:hypothetical protein